MTPKKALLILQCYAPCTHENSDTNCGDGKIWAKCENCGVIFLQENWERTRKKAKEFDEAISLLTIMAENGTAKNDLEILFALQKNDETSRQLREYIEFIAFKGRIKNEQSNKQNQPENPGI